LGRGDILFIEPEIHHRFFLAAGQGEGRIAGMHFEFISSGRWAAGDYRLVIRPDLVTQIEESPYLPDRFIRMAEVYASYRPYRKELVNSIAHEIILLLASYWQNKTLWA
jgi:predicted glycosyl hydrolase (DUF1957 family)